jgi:thiamine pyrophosphate-dependent acetolactate synthase large subunit-like protein
VRAKEAIVEFFRHKGAECIFYLPGIHTLPLNEMLARKSVRAVMGRHEAHLAYMAVGYAKASGRVGIVVVTPGPGLGNVVSACMEAHGDQVPLLVIHIDTDRRDFGKGVLHELPEPEAMFTRFTKRRSLVENTESLIPELEIAYGACLSVRPGPVLVSIPHTMLEKEVPFTVTECDAPVVSSPDLSSLSEVLTGKQRPVIIGGGALMRDELRLPLETLCTEASIPFLTTAAGKGILREDGEETFGCVMRKGVVRHILETADVVIAMGTRLREMDARRRGVKLGDLIHIDVDREWLGRNYPTMLGIAGNLGTAVQGLSELLRSKQSAWDLIELKERQKREEAELEKKSDGLAIVRLLRMLIPEETVTVWDLNLLAYWAEYYFPVLHQHTFIEPRGSSSIFYGVPASIGAKLGAPHRPCLCVVGDGSALPTLAELATANQYRIPVTFLVYNNNSYGVLDEYMRRRYGLEHRMDLVNPDFVKLAHAFDIKAARAENIEALRDIFLHEVSWDEPFLIELRYPVFAPPWEI